MWPFRRQQALRVKLLNVFTVNERYRDIWAAQINVVLESFLKLYLLKKCLTHKIFQHMRSQYLLVQIQQWKHHKIFETCSKLTTSNASEQVNAGWVGFLIFWIFQLTSRYMSYFLNAFLTALNVDQYSATLLRVSSKRGELNAFVIPWSGKKANWIVLLTCNLL